MKLGYLGPPGSYSYEAACLYAANAAERVEYVPLPSFAAIVDGVEQGNLAMGILPIENSTYGAVATVMDTLLRLSKSTVCGELILNIEHCLLGTVAKVADIKYVYSHEQALEQCRRFFTSHYSHIEWIPCPSTSRACELAAESGAAYGAVASKTAAGLYNLSVMEPNIQDNAFNQTRFFIIGCKETEPTEQDKTSIVFAFSDDCPGSLYGILQLFACHSINLTRIESRPAKHLMGKYIFHIDFLAHRQDKIGRNVLEKIRRQVEWLKVLGSYAVAGGTI